MVCCVVDIPAPFFSFFFSFLTLDMNQQNKWEQPQSSKEKQMQNGACLGSDLRIQRLTLLAVGPCGSHFPC